jgi:signal transduction histidine kinase
MVLMLASRTVTFSMARWSALLIMFVTLLGLATRAVANGPDLIVERAWLEDKGGKLSWEQVQQSGDWHIEPDSPVINRGYGANPIWFRLRIDPTLGPIAPHAKLMMRVRPSYLDELVLFDPLQAPAEQHAVGDHHARLAVAEHTSSHSYLLPAGTQSRYVWVRLSTTSTRMAHFEVMEESIMRQSNIRIEHFSALYLSVLFVFIVWGLFQLTIKYDRLIINFVAYQTTALLFGACLLGYASLYLEPWFAPKTLDKMMNVLAIASTYMVTLFSQQILETHEKYRWRRLFEMGLHMTFFTCFALLGLDQIRLAAQLNMSIIFFVPMYYFWVAIFTPQKQTLTASQKIPKWVILPYLGITLSITLLASLPALNLAGAAPISHYVVSFYSVCSGLMMMAVIQYRTVRNIKERSRLFAVAKQADLQAEHERMHRKETEQLLVMLGHELKTPLSTLLLQANDPQIPKAVSKGLGAAVSDMSHVIERTIQVGQLDHRKLEVQALACDLPGLISDLVQSLPESDRVELQIAPTGDRHLMTDVYLLSSIVRNLLDNALKYSLAGSRVSAHLHKSIQPAEWHFTVSNRPGRAGWPDASRVFDKYYRSPAASYRSGTGLGLFLIKSLAERLDYRIEYIPNEHSIVFHLTIPIKPEE